MALFVELGVLSIAKEDLLAFEDALGSDEAHNHTSIFHAATKIDVRLGLYGVIQVCPIRSRSWFISPMVKKDHVCRMSASRPSKVK